MISYGVCSHTDVTWPNGLTINFDGTNSETRRLYWADAGFKAIESIRLDGSGRQRVLQSDSILPHPFGITVHSVSTSGTLEMCSKSLSWQLNSGEEEGKLI